MTKDIFNEKIKQINDSYERARRELMGEYAAENNPHKKGDIITDHLGSLKIEKIILHLGYPYPQCIYTGVELTKSGDPMKRQSGRKIYQQNIIP